MQEETSDFAASIYDLPDTILKGIYAYGFETMSPIQQKSLRWILGGRDMIIQAQSGTGKTAAFGIGAAVRALASERGRPSVAIVCHTRELARQTRAVVGELARFSELRIGLCMGGTTVREDAEAIAAGMDIVVGTPGRMQTLVKRGLLRLDGLRSLVIDEVDVILRDVSSNSFLPCITDLLSACSEATQLLLVSATVPDELLAMTETVLRDPVRILVPNDALPLAGIDQAQVHVADEAQRLAVAEALRYSVVGVQVMVFCSSRDEVDAVAAHFQAMGTPVAKIHSGIEQAQRNREMREFRSGTASTMVCTDVLARGVDVQQVGLVILMHVPGAADTYLHCVGRCGRYGRQGRAVTIAAEYELAQLRSIQQLYDLELPVRSLDMS